MPKVNELFEKYYDALGLVESAEREEFWTALRRELPNSFRFTGSRGYDTLPKNISHQFTILPGKRFQYSSYSGIDTSRR